MKLKALESNFPCRCNHAEKQHGVIRGYDVCWGCHGTMEEYRHKFEADNLKYLEQLYNDSIK